MISRGYGLPQTVRQLLQGGVGVEPPALERVTWMRYTLSVSRGRGRPGRGVRAPSGAGAPGGCTPSGDPGGGGGYRPASFLGDLMDPKFLPL